ncbi:hypothetical protein GA0070609_3394 [Micromonospora echinaurantiaca]|uniref:Uncharacterized protein n=1 Tax=Micromonospora echinaurantiaca TaxID=47857 RepID=A0A1C5II28_9ACTN|nr:hypothetical protein [Micromonospora echinaurantiaca]SCG58017.1 hypothetical protein GA0070609_3394 [Micromonospora echinaurantiaca]
MTVYLVRRAFRRSPPAVAWLLAIAVGLGTWATAPYAPTSGLADPLWSVCLVGAAAGLLLEPHPFRRPALALLLLTVAVLTKNEGMVTGSLLALLVVIRSRRELHRAWLVWLPVLAGGGWALLVRGLGARSDVTEGSRMERMLAGGPEVLDRAGRTLDAFRDNVGPLLTGTVLVALFGMVFLRRQRRAKRLGSDLWLWNLLVGYLTVLALTHVVGPNDIQWWLRTSVARVTLPGTLLAILICAGWIAAAIGQRPSLEHADEPYSGRANPPPAIEAEADITPVGPRCGCRPGKTKASGPSGRVMALRHAGSNLGRHLFEDGIMYASSEPCPCASGLLLGTHSTSDLRGEQPRCGDLRLRRPSVLPLGSVSKCA